MTASALQLPRRPDLIYGYARKSKEEADKQVASIERQQEEVGAWIAAMGWGQVDRWFVDTQSAKDFDRPAFREMLAVCRTAPRGTVGRVVCLDYDRFARSVDKQFKVNPIEYQRQIIALHDAGFELDYKLTPKSGDLMADSLMGTMKSLMAAEYIAKLSLTSRSGKRKAGVSGLWIGSGAPFPADRYDARSGRRLDVGERAGNGASVLGPPADASRLQAWIDGAEMLCAGASLDRVAQMLVARGVESHYARSQSDIPGDARGTGSWGHRAISNIYRNPAIIGRVEYNFTRGDGSIETIEADAQWAPIVPVDLWRAVNDELNRRSLGSRAKPNRDYVLDLTCYRCGAHYVAATVRQRSALRAGEVVRKYTHPVPTSKMSADQAAKTAAAGCKHWYVDAVKLESAVRDLIIEQRSSREFYDQFIAMLEEQGALEGQAEGMEKQAEARVRALQKKRDNLRSQLEDAEDAETRSFLLERVTELTREIQTATEDWRQARARRESTAGMNEELLQAVEEAKNVERMWAMPGEAGVEARRGIINRWVFRAEIDIVESEGRQRGLAKKLYVWLRTAPNVPRVLEILPQHLDRDSSSEECRRGCTLGPVCFVIEFQMGG